MMDYFAELRRVQHTDCQIKIRFAWRLYLQKKKIKAEKKRKKAEAAASTKKGYGGRKTTTRTASNPSAVTSPQKFGSTV